MKRQENDEKKNYKLKVGTIILVDISGFATMVYCTDQATGKNIILQLLSSIIRQ